MIEVTLNVVNIVVAGLGVFLKLLGFLCHHNNLWGKQRMIPKREKRSVVWRKVSGRWEGIRSGWTDWLESRERQQELKSSLVTFNVCRTPSMNTSNLYHLCEIPRLNFFVIN